MYPVTIITKNSLIERDIDILSEMAKHRLVNVMISITTLDESLRSKMEPRTTTSKRRFETIGKLADAGIPTGLMNAPIIPGLNNHEIPEIIKKAAEMGAVSAGYTVIRLNGAVGDLFKDWLIKNYPSRFNKVVKQIERLHGGTINDSVFTRRMSGSGEEASSIRQLFKTAKKKYMPESQFPPLDLTKFRKGGNYKLF